MEIIIGAKVILLLVLVIEHASRNYREARQFRAMTKGSK
jgi:hypothetical protein